MKCYVFCSNYTHLYFNLWHKERIKYARMNDETTDKTIVIGMSNSGHIPEFSAIFVQTATGKGCMT